MLDPNSPIQERQRLDDASFRELLSKLVEDGKQFGRAEIDLLRAQALYRVAIYRKVAIFGFAGYLIAQAAVGALLVGLILSLEPLMGPFLATILVIVAALAIAGVLFLLAVKRLKTAGADREASR